MKLLRIVGDVLGKRGDKFACLQLQFAQGSHDEYRSVQQIESGF